MLDEGWSVDCKDERLRAVRHTHAWGFKYLVGNFGSKESAAQKNEKAHGKDESLQNHKEGEGNKHASVKKLKKSKY